MHPDYINLPYDWSQSMDKGSRRKNSIFRLSDDELWSRLKRLHAQYNEPCSLLEWVESHAKPFDRHGEELIGVDSADLWKAMRSPVGREHFMIHTEVETADVFFFLRREIEWFLQHQTEEKPLMPERWKYWKWSYCIESSVVYSGLGMNAKFFTEGIHEQKFLEEYVLKFFPNLWGKETSTKYIKFSFQRGFDELYPTLPYLLFFTQPYVAWLEQRASKHEYLEDVRENKATGSNDRYFLPIEAEIEAGKLAILKYVFSESVGLQL